MTPRKTARRSSADPGSGVLTANDRIVKIGAVDRRPLATLGVAYDVVDAADGLVVPGLVDPHEYLLGGSGEGGLELQTPMLSLREIVRAGVTTVVGTLGVDTTTLSFRFLAYGSE